MSILGVCSQENPKHRSDGCRSALCQSVLDKRMLGVLMYRRSQITRALQPLSISATR